jgi:hypothetical protein
MDFYKTSNLSRKVSTSKGNSNNDDWIKAKSTLTVAHTVIDNHNVKQQNAPAKYQQTKPKLKQIDPSPALVSFTTAPGKFMLGMLHLDARRQVMLPIAKTMKEQIKQGEGQGKYPTFETKQWAMESLGAAFGLPLSDHELISDVIELYRGW